MLVSNGVPASIFDLIFSKLFIIKTSGMKLRINFMGIFIITLLSLFYSSCKKSSPTVQAPAAGTNTFWHGYVGASSSTGPGNAILLRGNGTMRQYANNYYAAGTMMGAGDTATATVKLDGTYTAAVSGSTTTITTTWYQPNGAPALTYTTTGVVTGNMMTGTIKSVGTGISSTANLWLTSAP